MSLWLKTAVFYNIYPTNTNGKYYNKNLPLKGKVFIAKNRPNGRFKY